MICLARVTRHSPMKRASALKPTAIPTPARIAGAAAVRIHHLHHSSGSQSFPRTEIPSLFPEGESRREAVSAARGVHRHAVMWNRVVPLGVLLVGVLLPLRGQAQVDSKPSNLTLALRFQPPAIGLGFTNGSIDGASVLGGGLGLQRKEFWMVEAGGGLLFWMDYRKSRRYEAHLRAGIAPILADGRVEGSGWVLQAQILAEIQYLGRYLDCSELGCNEDTTGLAGRVGLEALRWSRSGRSAFTTRLSVGYMIPLDQTVTGYGRDIAGRDDLHSSMDVALDIGIAFR